MKREWQLDDRVKWNQKRARPYVGPRTRKYLVFDIVKVNPTGGEDDLPVVDVWNHTLTGENLHDFFSHRFFRAPPL